MAQDVPELASIGIDGMRQLLVRSEDFVDAVDVEDASPEAAGPSSGHAAGGSAAEEKSDGGGDDDDDDDDSADVDIGNDEDEDDDEGDSDDSDPDAAAAAPVGDPYGLHDGPSLTCEPKKFVIFHPDRAQKLLECLPAARLSEEQWTHICDRLQVGTRLSLVSLVSLVVFLWAWHMKCWGFVVLLAFVAVDVATFTRRQSERCGNRRVRTASRSSTCKAAKPPRNGLRHDPCG